MRQRDGIIVVHVRLRTAMKNYVVST